MEVPKVVNKAVPTISDDELASIIKACAGRAFDGRRDEALARFLLDTGCRVSELSGLMLDDLDLDRETALVLGKATGGAPSTSAPALLGRSTGICESDGHIVTPTPPRCSCHSAGRCHRTVYATC